MEPNASFPSSVPSHTPLVAERSGLWDRPYYC